MVLKQLNIHIGKKSNSDPCLAPYPPPPKIIRMAQKHKRGN